MNELFLFVVFAIIIFGGYFLLKKVPKPAINYIKILMAIALLVLVWSDWDPKNTAPQYMLTALALASIIMESFELKKAQRKEKL